MTITGRYSLSLAGVALLAGLLLLGVTAFREYHAGLDRLQLEISARLATQPDFAWQFYREAAPVLDTRLRTLTSTGQIETATAYNRIGGLITHLGSARPTVALNAVREGLSTTEPALVGFANGEPAGTGFWAALRGSQGHLSLPILSTLNPAPADLTRYDFLLALADADRGSSDFVLGYLELVIDLRSVLAGAAPLLWQLGVGWLALIVAGLGAVWWLNRRLGAELGLLSAAMDRLAEGDLEPAVPALRGGETGDIASALSRLVTGLRQYHEEIALGRKLLSRKVEERAGELSRTHQELDRATEHVSATERQVHQLTYYDSLTSLPNRRLFIEQFALMLRLTQRHQRRLALLYIDLRRFDRINDALGHSVGDRLLREVGKRLQTCIRDSDTLARTETADDSIDVSRLGGDEFTVVLNQLEEEADAQRVAQRIINELEAPLIHEEQSVTITPVIGIALAPRHGDSVEDLLGAASAAMREARSRHEGSGYCMYAPEMRVRDDATFAQWSALRSALDEDRLSLAFVPRVDTVMGSVIALASHPTWNSDGAGQVGGQALLQLAQDSGLGQELGAWLLSTAMARFARLQEGAEPSLRLALALPPALLDVELPALIGESLSIAGLQPQQLELQFPARSLGRCDRATLDGLFSLRSSGSALALTGLAHESLAIAQLAELPIDTLVIDAALVDRSEQNNDWRALTTLATLASHLELVAVVDGVKDESTYRQLAAHRLRQMQGELFSAPMADADLAPLLVPWHFIEQIQTLRREEPDHGAARHTR